jgi:hypothetical protein
MKDKDKARDLPPTSGTTRSPADEDIFADRGPPVPVKDRQRKTDERDAPSSEAGGVD